MSLSSSSAASGSEQLVTVLWDDPLERTQLAVVVSGHWPAVEEVVDREQGAAAWRVRYAGLCNGINGHQFVSDGVHGISPLMLIVIESPFDSMDKA
jgi:hypothetical protein